MNPVETFHISVPFLDNIIASSHLWFPMRVRAAFAARQLIFALVNSSETSLLTYIVNSTCQQRTRNRMLWFVESTILVKRHTTDIGISYFIVTNNIVRKRNSI